MDEILTGALTGQGKRDHMRALKRVRLGQHWHQDALAASTNKNDNNAVEAALRD